MLRATARTLTTFLFGCAAVAAATPAWATVDGLARTTIVTQDPQADGYCYLQIPIAVEVGIGLEAQTEGSLAPTFVYRNRPYAGPFAELTTIAGRSYVNANAISLGVPIEHTYVEDRWVNGVIEYELVLDVSALAAHNGSTVDGRQRTITQAKLALLALARNLDGYAEPYRLYASFRGLPSQSGLEGTTLHATTNWPYTATSSLLAAYEAELIGDYCPSFSDGGKSDRALPLEPEDPAGCTLSSGEPRSAGGLIFLAGVVLLALRRRNLPGSLGSV